MTDKQEKHCEPCRVGAPTLTEQALQQLATRLPDWQVIDVNGVKQLQRIFAFPNFVEAQTFTNKVADLAESEGHHPALLLEWGRVTVSWWTHKIGGLHENDVLMAEKTNDL